MRCVFVWSLLVPLYIKCSQKCVSVFSLVHVVKRGLISSDVIHTVASHYFQSAQSAPYSLSLLPPTPNTHTFCSPYFKSPPFLDVLSAPHTTQHTPASCCFLPSLPPLPFPLSSSWFYFILLPLTLISPFITSTFLSLSTLSITFPMVDIHNSLVFTLRPWAHQQKGI